MDKSKESPIKVDELSDDTKPISVDKAIIGVVQSAP